MTTTPPLPRASDQAADQTLEQRLESIREFGDSQLFNDVRTGQIPIHTALERIESERAAIAHGAAHAPEGEQPDDLPRLPAPTRLHYGLHYRADDMEEYARDAVDMTLARQSQAKPVPAPSAAPTCKPAQAAGQWVRCTPNLILAGVDCRHTPRRPGDGTYSHDHFIAHDPAPVAALEAPATEQQAATASASESMYQAQFDGEYGSSVWHDVTEAAYHTFMPKHRRIVCRAPSRAADGQQGAAAATTRAVVGLGATVYVCPERDIECGSRAASWCATCPKRRTPADGQQGASRAVLDVDQMRTAFENCDKYRSKLMFKRGGSAFAEDIPPGDYVDSGMQAAWVFWQEAWAAAIARAPLPAQDAVAFTAQEAQALNDFIPKKWIAWRMTAKMFLSGNEIDELERKLATQSRAQSDTTGGSDA